MSHTPGPWMIEGESGNPGEAEVITSTGRTICWTANTCEYDADEEVITAEDRANARLIAAAPELLELVRTARVVVESAGHMDLSVRMWNAIAKAEGRE